MSQTPKLIEWVERVIRLGRQARESAIYLEDERLGHAPWETFRAATNSFTAKIYPDSHPHVVALQKQLQGYYADYCDAAVGILEVIRDEIAEGWLLPLRELLTAEIFSDFLEMAEHYLELGHKDPAAVMIGSVLEEHLRKLATRNAIPLTYEKDGKQVPKKADTLNAELAKAEAYNKLDQKSVTMWLDLRNHAAHGKYDQYTAEQVQLMLQGVLNFVQRISVR